jgi:2-alkyl-3-oxoalkanoate reductase
VQQGGPIKAEPDPLDESPPPNTGHTYAAITHLDQATLAFGGIALRYGGSTAPSTTR